MTDYTITNFDELEGSSRGGVEGVFARKHLDSRELGVSRFRYGAGVKAPYGHRHGSQEEAYVVVSGSGRMKLNEEVIDLKQWDVVRVASDVIRGFEGGPDGLELIAIGGERPPDGDGEMVDDFWA